MFEKYYKTVSKEKFSAVCGNNLNDCALLFTLKPYDGIFEFN
jgi:hypothetical protein